MPHKLANIWLARQWCHFDHASVCMQQWPHFCTPPLPRTNASKDTILLVFLILYYGTLDIRTAKYAKAWHACLKNKWHVDCGCSCIFAPWLHVHLHVHTHIMCAIASDSVAGCLTTSHTSTKYFTCYLVWTRYHRTRATLVLWMPLQWQCLMGFLWWRAVMQTESRDANTETITNTHIHACLHIWLFTTGGMESVKLRDLNDDCEAQDLLPSKHSKKGERVCVTIVFEATRTCVVQLICMYMCIYFFYMYTTNACAHCIMYTYICVYA